MHFPQFILIQKSNRHASESTNNKCQVESKGLSEDHKGGGPSTPCSPSNPHKPAPHTKPMHARQLVLPALGAKAALLAAGPLG
jgi:hypothetical protein